VFIPHQGCPHQCVFCNQKAITGAAAAAPDQDSVRRHIDMFLGYRRKRHGFAQISFFGGNFLGLPEGLIVSLLDLGMQDIVGGRIDSIRFSTRPDTITSAIMALLKPYPVGTVEIGVQSMDDRVLTMAKRGHTAGDTRLAVKRLKAEGIQVGLQMMVGLPGDNRQSLMATARRLIDLKPDFIRIYPTLVLAGSPLAQWYRKDCYHPLGLDDAVDLVKELYLMFRKNRIGVIRMGLQASEELNDGAVVLAGPYHPAFGHLVQAKVFLDRMRILLETCRDLSRAVQFRVHPHSIPRARGLKNDNIRILKREFRLNQIKVLPDPRMEMDHVRLV
jgi:histone acetyltransferase (RNA polymerase elongator complex component)